jgi:hypothetical protein
MDEQLIARIRAEFLEMPGLHLTLAQARRLWHLDDAVCRAALDELVRAHFLAHHANGRYSRVSEHRRQTPKPRMAKADVAAPHHTRRSR